MGRPIKAKFFNPVDNTAGGRVLIGGEGVTSTSGNVAVTFSNRGLGYFSANAVVTFSAPQLPTGTTATGTVILFANGAVNGVGLSSAGTGYTTKPTLTFTGANTTPAVGTITGGGLNAAVTNVIACTAFIPTANGGSSAVAGDIVSQKGSRRFKVITAQGTGVCKLASDTPTAGQMTITAVDDENYTYYVTKLNSRKATLVPYGAGTHQFALNDDGTSKSVPWVINGTHSSGYSVNINTN
jgi:hypothetical protein